jgi:hypothetical protein
LSNPGVFTEIIHLGNKEPNAAHDMDHQEHEGKSLNHSADTRIHFELREILDHSHELEEPKDSQKSIDSWHPRNSHQLVSIVFKDLEWNASKKVKKEPRLKVGESYLLQSNF